MHSLSPEDFAALIGGSTIIMLFTTGGVVIEQQGKPERTIIRFDDADPEIAEAARSLVGALFGLHDAKTVEALMKEAAQRAAELVERVKARLDLSEVAAIEAAFVKGGLDVVTVRTEKEDEAARIEAERQATLDAETASVLPNSEAVVAG